jgi:phage-related tail fiber protein
MDRAFSSGASGTPPSAPGSPSTGYATSGNPGTATPATKPGAYWYHMVTEELRALIVAAGLTPDHTNTSQIAQAVQALIAAGEANDYKASVRVATTANIAALAGGAPNTLDGVTLVVNDRILVKDQTTASQNGIYVVTTLGTGVNGTWTRATDADGVGELTSGALVTVEQGTTLADSQWQLTTDGTITIGTTSLVFTRNTSVAQASAGEVSSESAVLKFISPDRLVNSKRVAKGWVHANAAGTILSSFGVSSVTKNGAGDFTINWSAAQANANYPAFITARPSITTYGASFVGSVHPSTAPTTTALRVWFTYQDDNSNSVAAPDPADFYVIIFGD